MDREAPRNLFKFDPNEIRLIYPNQSSPYLLDAHSSITLFMKNIPNNSPRISVLMPVYNASKYVRGAVESILKQTFRDFEFIIIDDGSTDASADIIRSYLDPRITYLKNSANIGIAASLNKGLSMARGDYIARMDADDISMPKRLDKQVDFLNQNDRTGVVGSAIRIIDQKGRPYHI